jgi:hypothetical protein
MKWIFRRLLIVWLGLTALCTAVVLLGQLDKKPSVLQLLGVDVCDGQPCYKGVKPGMEWARAQKLVPEAIKEDGYLQLPTNVSGLKHVLINASKDDKFVHSVGILVRIPDDEPLPFSAGDVIAQYGSPCHVYLQYADGIPGAMILLYPTLTVYIDVAIRDSEHLDDYRLQLNSSVWDFEIVPQDHDHWGTCNDATDVEFGLWHGFTSVEVYRDHNLNELSTAQPVDDAQ